MDGGKGGKGGEEEDGKISLMCESIGHLPLQGHCPKSEEENVKVARSSDVSCVHRHFKNKSGRQTGKHFFLQFVNNLCLICVM